jgi:hypothetical protein
VRFRAGVLVRLRLADRIRSVALEMRPAMLLSTLLRPRVWPLREVGGAGGAMMGTVASLTGIATGTGGGGGDEDGGWSSSITISIVPDVLPP